MDLFTSSLICVEFKDIRIIHKTGPLSVNKGGFKDRQHLWNCCRLGKEMMVQKETTTSYWRSIYNELFQACMTVFAVGLLDKLYKIASASIFLSRTVWSCMCLRCKIMWDLCICVVTVCAWSVGLCEICVFTLSELLQNTLYNKQVYQRNLLVCVCVCGRDMREREREERIEA